MKQLFHAIIINDDIRIRRKLMGNFTKPPSCHHLKPVINLRVTISVSVKDYTSVYSYDDDDVYGTTFQVFGPSKAEPESSQAFSSNFPLIGNTRDLRTISNATTRKQSAKSTIKQYITGQWTCFLQVNGIKKRGGRQHSI